MNHNNKLFCLLYYFFFELNLLKQFTVKTITLQYIALGVFNIFFSKLPDVVSI
jgi:hypothetical protein